MSPSAPRTSPAFRPLPWLLRVGILASILLASPSPSAVLAAPPPLPTDSTGVDLIGDSASLRELALLQRQALRHAQLDTSSGRQLLWRLRLSALLPQLRTSIGRGTQWVYSSRGEAYSEPVQDGDRMTYSLSAGWDLSRILFAREEIALHRDAERAAIRRGQLLLQVADLYTRRCQLELQFHRTHTPPSPGELPPAANSVAATPHTPDPAVAAQALALDITLAALAGQEAHSPIVQHCPREPSVLPSSPAQRTRPRRSQRAGRASAASDDTGAFDGDSEAPEPPASNLANALSPLLAGDSTDDLAD